MEKEKWKKLYDFDGYEVSNFGNVRSLDREIITKNEVIRFVKGDAVAVRKVADSDHLIFEIRYGYDKTKKKYKRKTMSLARAVADHFVFKPSSKEKLYASHKDKDCSNNHFSNIIWLTQSEIIKKQNRDYFESWEKRKQNKDGKKNQKTE